MERKLNTIQKVEKLNNVFAVDEPGPGGANHKYAVRSNTTEEAHDYAASVHGVLDTDLLEIVKDRLQGFQSGDFATEDNAKALEHIEIALMYMNKRVMDRYERNVLGTYEK